LKRFESSLVITFRLTHCLIKNSF